MIFGLNSSLGASFALGENFERSQTISLASRPKFSPNTKSPPQILEFVFIKFCHSERSEESKNSPSLAEGARWWVKTPSLRGVANAEAIQTYRHTERSEVSKSRESSKNNESMTQKRINKSYEIIHKVAQ